MELEVPQAEFIKEKRLVSTLISGRVRFDGSVIMFLTIIFMALFSLAYWFDLFKSAHLLPAIKQNIYVQGQWWRIFTSIFIHGDIGHFLSNMLLLSVFSYLLSSYFNLRLFLVYSLLGAGAVNAVAIYTYPLDVRLIGASGLVYLLGGLWLTLYFLIQRQYSIVSRVIRVLGVGIMLFFPSTFMPNTSYRTHAIGILFGIFIGLIYFYQNKNHIRAFEVYKESLIEI